MYVCMYVCKYTNSIRQTDLLSVEVNISPYGASAAGEGEEWQRDRNGHIDANLTYVDLMLYVFINVCMYER